MGEGRSGGGPAKGESLELDKSGAAKGKKREERRTPLVVV